MGEVKSFMNEIDYFVEGTIRGIHDDYTGLWMITSYFRDDLKIESDAEVKEKSFEVVRKLMERNIMPGYLANNGGFTFWQGTPEELLARIDAEWPKTGIPTLGDEQCWFALKKV